MGIPEELPTDSSETRLKKKDKKRKREHSSFEDSDVQRESVIEPCKKKKKQRKSTSLESDDVNKKSNAMEKTWEGPEQHCAVDLTRGKKSKKKKRKREEDVEEEEEIVSEEKIESPKKMKKKKKKDIESQEMKQTETDDTDTISKKKKKKHGKHDLKESSDDCSRNGNKLCVRDKKEKCEVKESTVTSIEDRGTNDSIDSDCSTKESKRKKKKKKDEVDNDLEVSKVSTHKFVDQCSNSNGETQKKKKSKKRKHQAEEEIRPHEPNSTAEEDSGKADVRKKKKKNKEKKENSHEETREILTPSSEMLVSNSSSNLSVSQEMTVTAKKKKSKKSDAEVEDDSETPPIKDGKSKKTFTENARSENSFNNSQIDEKQMESSGVSSSHGQWQGSLFEDTDRQNKFLRLLGGKKASGGTKSNGLFSSSNFGEKKKGLFGSLGSLVNKTSGGNVAMTASAAAALNQSLEKQYNTALNLKLGKGKGCGIGFTPDPAEGKKFHIDTGKVNSVRFDDD